MNQNRPREYTVDKIIRHIGLGRNIKYVIRWYGYSSEDNTIEPPRRILYQFVARYWSCRTKTVKRQKYTATRSEQPKSRHAHVFSRSRFRRESRYTTYLHQILQLLVKQLNTKTDDSKSQQIKHSLPNTYATTLQLRLHYTPHAK